MSFIADLGDWLRKISRSFSDVSVNGQNIVLTRHNGDTETITTQDTNTTYNPASQSADGLMSATDKTKLDGIATGAEVNQNAFSNVKVGATTVAADGKTDTFELVAGNNITLTPDATNDTITIAATDTIYSPVVSDLGNDYVMNVSDFTRIGMYKCASLAASPTGNAPDNNTGDYFIWALSNSQGFRVLFLTSPRLSGVNYIGHFWENVWQGWVKLARNSDIPSYSNATTSSAGLMSATDKTALDSVKDKAWTQVVSQVTSAPANTKTVLTSYTFTKTGVYATQYTVCFQSQSGTGIRSVVVSTTSGGDAIGERYVVNVVPPSTGYTFVQFTVIEKITAVNTKRYLHAKQTTSSAMNCVGIITVARLGDA